MAFKLSIITINYNNSIGLKKTMESVALQIWRDFEHIVIDGNSTDNSVSVIESFDYKNLHWTSEPDTGIYNAMNKGIKRSVAKYLLFLNSGDTLMDAEVLGKVNNYLNEDYSFIGCNLILDFPDGNLEKEHPQKLSFSYLLNKTVYHPSTFIMRDMFETYGLYNENFKIASDWEFFFKAIALNGEEFLNVPIALTQFDTQGSSSDLKNQKLIKSEKNQVLNQYLRSFANSELDTFVLSQLRNPSKRIKYLVRIEKYKYLRKITTVCLRLISSLTR
jgi:glycosyltransferase involved in cell wall biosynthesis